jgi:hypothetical protein
VAVRRGWIPARKLGRKLVFLRDDIETFLRNLPHRPPLAARGPRGGSDAA